MSSPPSSSQVASNIFPQYVSYGDILFIVLPLVPTGGFIVNGLSLDGQYISAIQGDISLGDPYVIDPPSGPPITQPATPQPVNNNARIRLRRYNSSNQAVWYNKPHKLNLELTTADINDDNAIWTITLQNSTSSDLPITYQSQFSLQNYNNEYINLNITQSPSNGNFIVDTGLSGSGHYGTFSFLYGPLSAAQLQCCTNNPAYGNFCGSYQGNQTTGLCDTILTNYCNIVAMADINCGCLLPSSYYMLPDDQSYPECIDTRCYNVDTAYKTSTQVKTPCDVTICNDVDGDNIFQNISQNAINQYCGPEHTNSLTSLITGTQPDFTTINEPQGSPPITSTPIWKNIYFWVGVVVVFLILIGMTFLIMKNKNKHKKNISKKIK
ncbi:putative virion-associated membrane protein [Tupanvirus soda lake]|uniref:Virion-associated membrane protein n=2 Tax=Tupanvirus TaxID=2094720 RepID=A0AC62ACC4_9VIRU|nr:putative virion-associated membrane protein [Tupanvirus soda lake]QKU35440.1 putative virion-associated membrane protein [Tupanvirus soda lake]